MKILIQLATALLALTLAHQTFAAAEAEDAAPGALTNSSSNHVTATGSISIGPHGIVVPGDARYPFPPEIMSKFTPEQLLQLEHARASRSQAEDILVPIGFFGGTVVIVALVTAYRFKKTRMVQETIRLMVEKGAPIPPELLLPPEPRKRPRSDLRSGLAWFGIGVALLICLSGLGHRLWALGLIPLLIGVAYLVTWKVEQKKVQ